MNGMIKNVNAGTRPNELIPLNGSRDKKGTGQGLCVLIVEDYDLSRQCLEDLLQKYGYRVRSFRSAEDGLRELESYHFDLLLTDLHLPGMDGFELIAKAKTAQPSINTFLMTAVVSKEVCERGQAEGIDGLMEKPIELKRLLAFLEAIAFRKRQEKTSE